MACSLLRMKKQAGSCRVALATGQQPSRALPAGERDGPSQERVRGSKGAGAPIGSWPHPLLSLKTLQQGHKLCRYRLLQDLAIEAHKVAGEFKARAGTHHGHTQQRSALGVNDPRARRVSAGPRMHSRSVVDSSSPIPAEWLVEEKPGCTAASSVVQARTRLMRAR